MAREFGIRSYKPEDINFTSSGSMNEKYPWSVVRRVIPKNILLETHNNPSTIQELSLELGIAAPYLEEEIGFLLDSTLLVKTDDDKYITNFYIFDRDTQREIYHYLKNDLKLQAEKINKITTETFDKIMKIDFKYNGTSDDFKWFIVLYMMDVLYNCYSDFEYPERPDGCKWMFTGYESGVGSNDGKSLGHIRSCIDDGCNAVGVFNFCDGKGMDWRAGNINNKKCMESIKLLIQMIRNNKNINSLNDIEKNDWSRISGTLAHSASDGNVVLHIPVITPENENMLKEIITSHPEYEKLTAILAGNNKYIKNMLKDKSNSILHKYLGYYAGTIVGDNQIRIIHDLEDSGDLIIPSDPENSPMGIYLYFK